MIRTLLTRWGNNLWLIHSAIKSGNQVAIWQRKARIVSVIRVTGAVNVPKSQTHLLLLLLLLHVSWKSLNFSDACRHQAFHRQRRKKSREWAVLKRTTGGTSAIKSQLFNRKKRHAIDAMWYNEACSSIGRRRKRKWEEATKEGRKKEGRRKIINLKTKKRQENLNEIWRRRMHYFFIK